MSVPIQYAYTSGPAIPPPPHAALPIRANLALIKSVAELACIGGSENRHRLRSRAISIAQVAIDIAVARLLKSVPTLLPTKDDMLETRRTMIALEVAESVALADGDTSGSRRFFDLYNQVRHLIHTPANICLLCS